MNSTPENVNADFQGGRKRMNYTLDFKQMVVKYAEANDTSKAARKYDVPRQSVQRWRAICYQLDEEISEYKGAKKRRVAGAGRHLQDQYADEKLALWVKTMRKDKKKVTRSLIQKEAQKIMKLANFKASNGWLEKFLKRHNLTTRRATTVCQKPPVEHLSKIVDFLLYIEKMKSENNYQHIYSCDETAVFLDQSNSLTIEQKGAKEVSVRTTGHDKLHVTVMLCARNDGYKCRPFVLLPNKRPIQSIVDKFKGKLELSWCGRTFFNDEITTHFLKSIIGRSLFGTRLLVWDSFRCHLSEDTKKTLRSLNVHTAVVPGGTTKFIQAADVYWNSVFKAKIRQQYENWMLHGEKSFTSSGNMRAPSMEVYLTWIRDAWESLEKDLILKSFKGCGLDNSPDGSDDASIQCFQAGSDLEEGVKIIKERRLNEDLEDIENGLDAVDLEFSDVDQHEIPFLSDDSFEIDE